MRFAKLFAGIFLVLFLGILSAPLVGNMHPLAYFSPKDEEFTELYFEDHTNLPTHIRASTQYSFRFTIHNVTEKDQKYSYEVLLDTNGEKAVFQKQSVPVKKDEYKTIEETFFSPSAPARSKLIVQLPALGQHIDFWIEGER